MLLDFSGIKADLTEDVLPDSSPNVPQQLQIQAPADVLKTAGVKLLGQKGCMAMLPFALGCLFSLALYHYGQVVALSYSAMRVFKVHWDSLDLDLETLRATIDYCALPQATTVHTTTHHRIHNQFSVSFTARRPPSKNTFEIFKVQHLSF